MGGGGGRTESGRILDVSVGMIADIVMSWLSSLGLEDGRLVLECCLLLRLIWLNLEKKAERYSMFVRGNLDDEMKNKVGIYREGYLKGQ